MFIFGVNLPLPEIFLFMVMCFFVLLVMIIIQLRKLQKMSSEERKEIEELEQIAQEQKKEFEQIKTFEQVEDTDLSKFEKEIEALEENTDTLYLKKFAPDLYKIQNYTLYALSKGKSAEQIKQELVAKGWKDRETIETMVNDVVKHFVIFKSVKEVAEPAPKPEPIVEQKHEPPKIEAEKIKPLKVVKIKDTPAIRIVKKTEKPRKRTESNDLKDIEKELTVLEKKLKSEKPRSRVAHFQKKQEKQSKRTSKRGEAPSKR